MKIDFKKIDFRQGKYWFPLVLFVPLVAIAYFSCEMDRYGHRQYQYHDARACR